MRLADLGPLPLSIIASLLVAVLLLATRIFVLQRMQQRRQRENRQETERLKSLVAAYRSLAGGPVPAGWAQGCWPLTPWTRRLPDHCATHLREWTMATAGSPTNVRGGPCSNATRIVVSPPQFSDWTGLLALLRSAYAYMDPRVDPPSSLLHMDVTEFQEKARHEALILALENERILGCAFAAVRKDCVYVGKLAVDATARGRGIARKIMHAADSIARQNGRPCLELETRIELVENHKTFAALGFTKVAETAHPGFDRPTSITMRRPVPRQPE